MQRLVNTKCDKCGDETAGKNICDACQGSRHDTLANRFIIINGFLLLIVLSIFFMFYS